MVAAPRLAHRIYGDAVGEPVVTLVRHHHASVFAEFRSNDTKLGRQFIGEAGGSLAICEDHSVVIMHRASTNEVEIEPRHVDDP
jgi:hypothetical protein